MSKLKISAALLVIGAVSLAVPANAAPATPLSAAAKSMAPESDLVHVRFGGWHGGWHGGGGVPAGAVAGALIGAAIAAPYYESYAYYGDDYGYPAAPYGYPVPSYRYGYYQDYGYQRCWPDYFHCRWGG